MNKTVDLNLIQALPPSPVELQTLFTQLDSVKLSRWKAAMEKDFSQLTPEEQTLLHGYLKKWMNEELAERRSQKIKNRISGAHFVKTQTVDQYDFLYNESTRELKADYLQLIDQTLHGKPPSAIFVGNTGLGKTHLARALGYAGCQAGLSVLFTTVGEMVNALSTAKATQTLEMKLKYYRRPQLLIADEFGYVSMDIEASNLFFQVISARYDQGLGTIVTTNHPFGKWNQILASDASALAVVDRLTAEAEIFHIKGDSYREYQRKLKNAAKNKI
jgi:DNA replication protein DnaC